MILACRSPRTSTIIVTKAGERFGPSNRGIRETDPRREETEPKLENGIAEWFDQEVIELP